MTLLCGDLAVSDPLLLTVWDAGVPVGAALQTPPYPLLCSGLMDGSVDIAATEVAKLRPGLVGVCGIRSTATQFADVWRRVTGHAGTITIEERLFRLGELRPPAAVPGPPRTATDVDRCLLDAWLDDFHAEVFGDAPRGPHRPVTTLLWSVDGTPVSMAGVSPPAEGVARIGPVYTLREARGRGYGSAVTAAAAGDALRAGAGDAVLFTDLANPVSNAIYQRIGFEPVADSVRLDFTQEVTATG